MFAKSVFSFGQVLLLAMLMSFATTAVANGIGKLLPLPLPNRRPRLPRPRICFILLHPLHPK